MTNLNQTYSFSTDVSAPADQEFVVEFFQCLMDDVPEKFPYKVTKNFDELIDFFEQMDE
jgi:secreted protein with Ig-like and vWFA domain